MHFLSFSFPANNHHHHAGHHKLADSNLIGMSVKCIAELGWEVGGASVLISLSHYLIGVTIRFDDGVVCKDIKGCQNKLF